MSSAAPAIGALAPSDPRRRRADAASAEALAVRDTAPSTRERRPPTAALVVACVVACAVIDAVAAGILLVGTRLAPSLEGLAVAVLHGTAVLLLSGVSRARPSRQWLCVAAVLAVPFVGSAVAAATLVTKGRGSASLRRRKKPRRRPPLTMAAIQRLGTALSPCDALEHGDEEQRRAALGALSQRRDPEALALLRRAAASRDPDLALSAALVMDEIVERAERRLDPPDRADVGHGRV
jgi:hypothetical protein